MPPLSAIHASNVRIAIDLPGRLVGVFAGGTSGIGENTVKAFARYVKKPQIYFFGRSKEAGERIKSECEAINSAGSYYFESVDLAVLKNVDRVCRMIAEKEGAKGVNLVCVSQAVVYNPELTSEGFRTDFACLFWSRIRFITNLLPLLKKAEALRRVIVVGAGGAEGPIVMDDLSMAKMGYSKPLVVRGHLTSMTTFVLEHLANTTAPEVGFVHTFPAATAGGIFRGTNFFVRIMAFLLWLSLLIDPTGPEESGERHLWMGTSSFFSGKKRDEFDGVEWGGEGSDGTEGAKGTGVYTPGGRQSDNAALPAQQPALREMRAKGVREKVWDFVQSEYARSVGSAGL